jgi:hypothetical protein
LFAVLGTIMALNRPAAPHDDPRTGTQQ